MKEPPSVLLVGDWNDAENVDRFWAAVPAMQLKFAEVLRYVYDWKTKIAASNVKSMVQESMQWCELCQCCVAVLQRRGGGGQTFVDLYAEFMTARGKLEGELQGVGLQIALYKDGKESTLPSRVDVPRPVPAGAKKVAGGGSEAQMVHMRGLLAGMGELHGLSGSNELRHLGAHHTFGFHAMWGYKFSIPMEVRESETSIGWTKTVRWKEGNHLIDAIAEFRPWHDWAELRDDTGAVYWRTAADSKQGNEALTGLQREIEQNAGSKRRLILVCNKVCCR
jgi:hypothetical protein